MELSTSKSSPILIINPHADDFELGCGGTIAKWIEQGYDVHSVVLSLRRKTVPSNFPVETLYDETRSAATMIGLKPGNLHITDFDNRVFPALRQDILDLLVRFRRDLHPSLVLAPSFDDMHQDHSVAAYESFRAFKECSIISYELPWNRIVTHTTCYSILEEQHIKKKIDAMMQYKSQINRERSFFDSEYIRSLAISKGVQVKARYAETFEIVRWIL